MKRRLRTTASALIVSGTLFVLGLATFASASLDRAANSPVTVASAALVSPDSVEADSSPSPARPGRASRIRRSVAMPFFSFAPRG